MRGREKREVMRKCLCERMSVRIRVRAFLCSEWIWVIDQMRGYVRVCVRMHVRILLQGMRVCRSKEGRSGR